MFGVELAVASQTSWANRCAWCCGTSRVLSYTFKFIRLCRVSLKWSQLALLFVKMSSLFLLIKAELKVIVTEMWLDERSKIYFHISR